MPPQRDARGRFISGGATPAVSVDARGLIEARRDMERIAADLHGRPMLDAMHRATFIVEADAKRLAPVDTGRLRASIASEVRTEGKDVKGVVGSALAYAPHMELGTGTFVGRPRHFPPPRALEVWARRHGLPNGFVAARAIYRAGGLRPRRFLQRAFEQNQARIVRILGDGVKGIIE